MSIFLSGSSQGESLLGTFLLRNGSTPSFHAVGIAAATLDQSALVLDWNPPPPDGKWYPIRDGNFGPCLTELQVGFITDSDTQERLKPCSHSTIKGTIFSTEQMGNLDSQFTHPIANATGWYRPTADHYFGPQFGCPGGTPCKRLVEMRAYGRNTVREFAKYAIPLALDQNYEDYWYFTQRVSCQRTSGLYLTALSGEELVPYNQGEVIVRANSGALYPERRAWDNTWISKAQWTILERELWQREVWIEYHTTSSYTQQSSTGFLEIPYCRSGLYLVTRVRLKHIRSERPGHCHIRYDVSHSYQAKGWVPWAPFYEFGTVDKSQQQSAVIMLEPGVQQTWNSPDLTRAQSMCELAPDRLRESIDLSQCFSQSRLAALNDVPALESNWIENAAGLPGTFEVLNPLFDGANAVTQGDLALARNSLCSAYIAYRFAIAPNISDVKDINENLGDLVQSIRTPPAKPQRRRGKAHTVAKFLDGDILVDCFTEYYMTTKTNCFARLWNALEKLGFSPTAGHAWDLVPFSFVVDWFTNIGDILQDVSAFNSAVFTQDVIGAVDTAKYQYTISDYYLEYLFGDSMSFKTVGVPLTYSWYDRHVSNTLGEVNPFDLEVSSPTKSQFVLGTALVSVIFF